MTPKNISFDPYVIGSLMPDLVGHDGQPSAFLVYVYLWSRAGARQARAVPASYAHIGAETGLSRSAVQAAVATLRRRELVGVRQASATAIPEYTVLKPWHRPK